MASRPAPARPRPLSPHLSIWRWGPGMTVSIVHRVTGTGMATVGAVLLVWWLTALAAGPAAYETFRDVFTVKSGALNLVGWVVGVGLTLSLFQHMMSGVRHLFLDAGAAYELRVNKRSAQLTFVFAVLLTAAFWLYVGTK